MGFKISKALQNFYVLGINHSNTPVEIREMFAISSQKQEELLADAKSLVIEGFMILSTCNRTEIYTHTTNLDLIKRLFIKYSRGSQILHETYGYTYQGEEAAKHIFHVAVGLDSQILGDFQIVGQLKDAFRNADKYGLINTLMNRMLSFAFQASKTVKNETELSTGAASISYAAVQYIKENISNIGNIRVLLYGAGQIGKVTCANLLGLVDSHKITLINRSEERAILLANKYKVEHKTQEHLVEEIQKSDVIIVATGADLPTISQEHLPNCERPKYFMDLSVPRNVAPTIGEIENVFLTDIDQLSSTSEEALNQRKENIPLATSIINNSYNEFCHWLEIQQLSPIFKTVKEGLQSIKEQEIAYHRNKLTDEELEKVELIANNLVNRIGRMAIEHIKEVFTSENNSMDILQAMFSHEHTVSHQKNISMGHPKHIKRK